MKSVFMEFREVGIMLLFLGYFKDLVQWFGRVIGNHHLGTGGVREVDILKGVNMSFRQTAPGFLQFWRLLPKEGTLAGQKLLASIRGRWQGCKPGKNSIS